MSEQKRRARTSPWKHIYGTDRRYTARVNRAIERGEYTEVGTPPNPPKKQRRGGVAHAASADHQFEEAT